MSNVLMIEIVTRRSSYFFADHLEKHYVANLKNYIRNQFLINICREEDIEKTKAGRLFKVLKSFCLLHVLML